MVDAALVDVLGTPIVVVAVVVFHVAPLVVVAGDVRSVAVVAATEVVPLPVCVDVAVVHNVAVVVVFVCNRAVAASSNIARPVLPLVVHTFANVEAILVVFVAFVDAVACPSVDIGVVVSQLVPDPVYDYVMLTVDYLNVHFLFAVVVVFEDICDRIFVVFEDIFDHGALGVVLLALLVLAVEIAMPGIAVLLHYGAALFLLVQVVVFWVELDACIVFPSDDCFVVVVVVLDFASVVDIVDEDVFVAACLVAACPVASVVPAFDNNALAFLYLTLEFGVDVLCAIIVLSDRPVVRVSGHSFGATEIAVDHFVVVALVESNFVFVLDPVFVLFLGFALPVGETSFVLFDVVQMLDDDLGVVWVLASGDVVPAACTVLAAFADHEHDSLGVHVYVAVHVHVDLLVAAQ